jgi:hypothetical protein
VPRPASGPAGEGYYLLSREALTFGHLYSVIGADGSRLYTAHRPSYLPRDFAAAVAAAVAVIGVFVGLFSVDEQWAKKHEWFDTLGLFILVLGPPCAAYLAYTLLKPLPRVGLYHDEARRHLEFEIAATARFVFREARYELRDARGRVGAVVLRPVKTTSMSQRAWKCLEPGGAVWFSVLEGGADVAERRNAVLATTGANVVGAALLAVTGLGFRASREKSALAFQFFAGETDRPIGDLDRRTPGEAHVRLDDTFARHADPRLGMAVALLVDIEEPAKA